MPKAPASFPLRVLMGWQGRVPGELLSLQCFLEVTCLVTKEVRFPLVLENKEPCIGASMVGFPLNNTTVPSSKQ